VYGIKRKKGALPDVPQSHLACVCGLLLGAGAPAERARIGVKPAAWSIYLCFKEAVLYFSRSLRLRDPCPMLRN
jgi:hypothetical protein